VGLPIVLNKAVLTTAVESRCWIWPTRWVAATYGPLRRLWWTRLDSMPL